MPGRPVRRAGSRWRILVHEWLGTGSPTGFPYGHAYHVGSGPDAPRRHGETRRKLEELSPGPLPPDESSHVVLEGTEFDELVIGRWIHLEQMDAGKWWLSVGGVVINITADRDGRPKVVDIYGPGDYGDAVEGCRYGLTWSRP